MNPASLADGLHVHRMAVLLYIYVQKIYPTIYEWGRVVHIILVGVVIYVLGVVANNSHMAALAFAMAVIFPLALVVTGLPNKGERAKLRKLGSLVMGIIKS